MAETMTSEKASVDNSNPPIGASFWDELVSRMRAVDLGNLKFLDYTGAELAQITKEIEGLEELGPMTDTVKQLAEIRHQLREELSVLSKAETMSALQGMSDIIDKLGGIGPDHDAFVKDLGERSNVAVQKLQNLRVHHKVVSILLDIELRALYPKAGERSIIFSPSGKLYVEKDEADDTINELMESLREAIERDLPGSLVRVKRVKRGGIGDLFSLFGRRGH